MSVEFIRRYATGDYEYAEIKADTFEEFVEANAGMVDLLGSAAVDKAVETVKKGFGKTTEQPAKSGGFGNKGKQQSSGEERVLGKHDGYTIKVLPGKWGFYFNAYNSDTKDRVNVNLKDGQDPAEATLQDAIDALSAA